MAKNKSIVWTEIALDEYEKVIDWLLLNWSVKIAMDFSSKVEQKLKLISRFPQIGRKSEYLKDCRKLWVSPYHLLLYRVQEDSIHILRLFDGRQNTKLLQ